MSVEQQSPMLEEGLEAGAGQGAVDGVGDGGCASAVIVAFLSGDELTVDGLSEDASADELVRRLCMLRPLPQGSTYSLLRTHDGQILRRRQPLRNTHFTATMRRGALDGNHRLVVDWEDEEVKDLPAGTLIGEWRADANAKSQKSIRNQGDLVFFDWARNLSAVLVQDGEWHVGELMGREQHMGRPADRECGQIRVRSIQNGIETQIKHLDRTDRASSATESETHEDVVVLYQYRDSGFDEARTRDRKNLLRTPTALRF